MRMTLLLAVVLILPAIVLPQFAQSADELVSFEQPAQREMYVALLKEYRCLKCQNQNLSDSNASLAGDLRREIRDQILAGKDRSDINEYLVARYGEFVLYKPPFNSKTAILWLAPFALLIIALSSMVLMIRNRRRAQADADRLILPGANQQLDARLEKARQLLND